MIVDDQGAARINYHAIEIENEYSNCEVDASRETLYSGIRLCRLHFLGQTEMDEEFIRLGRGGNTTQVKSQSANMVYNKTKNRYANVLPFDDSRVKLSVVTGIEGSDYINASFIDGYMMRRAFVATQAPIPDTIPDFWRMIWEQESSTIVMLSKELESGKVQLISDNF